MNQAQRQEIDGAARRRSTTTIDRGALFTLTADGQAFQAPELFEVIFDNAPCQHRPGVVMAPIFGLPGTRSSVCADCGRAIDSAGAGRPWQTVGA